MPYSYINDFLKNLNSFEKKSIENYFNFRQTDETPVIRKYIENDYTLVKTQSQSSQGIRKLRSRAFDKIIDALVSDYHIRNNRNFAIQDQILLRLKKSMLFARIISKSLNQYRFGPFKTFLNVIISEAKKNEVYEVLTEALLLKKYLFALKITQTELKKIENEIRYYETCQKKMHFAGDCYFKIIINSTQLKYKKDKLFYKYIQRIIRILKTDYRNYRSAQINYYLQIILMFYYEKQKKYSLSAKYAKALFNAVKHSPIIYRTERLGNALINLSQYKTFTENFNDAARYAKESQKYYLPNSNNYITSKAQEFHIYFYHKKYEKAQEIIKELHSHKLIDTGNFTRSKYIYFQSALFFNQKKYKQGLNLLNKSLEIEKDKSGWNISLRILNIMFSIELNKLDETSRLLGSLKKFVERNRKNSEITSRTILIIKCLKELEKTGFNFNSKSRNIIKLSEELSQKNKITSWEYYSPELIPFHEWLLEKRQEIVS